MRNAKRLRWRTLICAGLLALPVAALADSYPSGIPSQIDVYNNGLVGFRVYLPITTGMCTGSSDNWAYLVGGSNPDANYNAFVAAILMAKAQGLTLQLITVPDGSGHCHIQYISVS